MVEGTEHLRPSAALLLLGTASPIATAERRDVMTANSLDLTLTTSRCPIPCGRSADEAGDGQALGKEPARPYDQNDGEKHADHNDLQ